MGKIEADNSDCIVHRYWCGNITYDPGHHPAKVIELGTLGYTKIQMASEFNVPKQTFYRWMKEHKEFGEAVDLALTHAQAKSERDLDLQATGEKDGDSKALMFKMKMQFKDDYTEVKQINKTNTLEIKALPDEQLNKQIAAKLKMLSADERKAMFPAVVIEGEFEEVSK